MSRRERPGHVPWTHPAAVGMAWGIVVAGNALPAAWLLLVVPALAWRPRAGLVLAVFAAFGWGNMQAWQARPDPFSGRHGTAVVLSGRTDGRILRADDPPGARVALAPAGAVPAGRVTLAGVLEPAPGKRNPGGFDYRGYLERRNVVGQLLVRDVRDHEPVPTLRGRLQAATRGLPQREAALVAAMTLGIRDDLGDLRDAFASAGLAHVLALSGLHVGVLVMALWLLARPLGRLRVPAVLVALAGFVALVGPSPSIVRASLMLAAVLVTRWRGGGILEPWTAFTLAAAATLAWRPAWLFDGSFQLSYLAVLGLLVFAPPMLRALRAHGKPWWHPRVLIAGSAAVSVATQIPMGSLLLASFGQIPWLSPLVNAAAMPVATALVPLGFLFTALGAVWDPLAVPLGLLVRPLAAALIWLAETGAGWPALVWGEIGTLGHIVYGLAVAALALCVHGRLRLHRAACVWLAAGAYGAIPPSLPQIVFLDVGQGDAVLVRLPGRRELLMDGGGSPFSDFDVGERVVVPALRALGVDELEVVVASHPDTDHIEGLASVVRAVPVQQLVVGVPAPGVRVYDELVAAAAETGVPIRPVRRGERIVLGEAVFHVLHPSGRPRGPSNEDSVALLFTWKAEPVALFLGDVSMEVERELAVPSVPLLMVAHHGSRHSTSDALLRAARPNVAVISVGRNTFGHPAPDVLERLEAYGVGVLTTREAGCVRVFVPDMLHSWYNSCVGVLRYQRGRTRAT